MMHLEKNMGTADLVIRAALGAAIVVSYATGHLKGIKGKLALALAGVFLTTSSVGNCPAYSALDNNSIPGDTTMEPSK